MPNRTASRASGFIDPSEGLSFSGAAVVVQQQSSSALKQTLDTASLESTSETSQEFVAAGLLPGSNPQPFPDGLLDPLEPLSQSVTSSQSAEETSPETLAAETDEEETVNPESLYADCDTSVSNIYCVYTIQEGDTLSSIANRFGLTSTEDFAGWEFLVRSNNSVVVDPDAVAPGLKLIIPRGNGVIHTVLTAETLTEIAAQYGVTVEDIMAIPENGLSDPNAITIGTEILIHNPTQFAPSFVPDEPAPTANDNIEHDASASESENTITGGGPSSASGFIWPAGGPISSYYGPSHPLGIDIDLFNNGGAPISAAMGGVVTFAGGNACCSYGYYVVVDHGNGYTTLYAHLSSIGVSVGETVAQGQYLGTGGSTGYSTGDHLHFEMTLNGSRVNPLNYLP